MGEMLRGLIVGAGHFAEIQMEAWQKVVGVRMEGVLDLSINKAERLAGACGITAFDNWVEAIHALRPDFIDICTPPDSHLHYVRLAADLGLPILCQKPLAPTEEESAEIVRYCEERNVPLMINENWRWQGWYREIKRMMDQGTLGEVYTAYFAMRPGDGWGDEPYPVQPYFRDMENFLIFETGVHWIDTFRYLFGEIDSVYCRTRTVNPVIRGEDLAVIHFNFKSGTVGIYDANRTTYVEQVRSPAYGIMTIEGTAGKLRLDENGGLYWTPRGGTERQHHYLIPAGWKGGGAIGAQRHFIEGLLTGQPFESSGPEYMRTVRLVYACYRSANDNQVVRTDIF